MGFFSASLISSSGMSVQRQVMDVISENLANVNTIEVEGGGPYRRKIPVVGTKQVATFSSLIGQRMQEVVSMKDVVEDTAAPKRVFEPDHPLADKDGYIDKPNINVSLEMINMIVATRAYEANVAAYNASKAMANKALQIGA
jgi:flagellar basal-body rod protein FlgC